MNKLTVIPLATASILAGCGDVGLQAARTTPKEAAELCTGWTEMTAAKEQTKVVASYRAGEISFNECLRRLRS